MWRRDTGIGQPSSEYMRRRDRGIHLKTNGINAPQIFHCYCVISCTTSVNDAKWSPRLLFIKLNYDDSSAKFLSVSSFPQINEFSKPINDVQKEISQNLTSVYIISYKDLCIYVD